MATLDRPDRHNALDVATARALTAGLSCGDGPVAPLVLTGAGPTFCSGFDLTEDQDPTEFKLVADALIDAVMSHPAPVIGALNGPAIGMGCVLAAACDIRIGCERSWLEVPAARLGFVLGDDYVATIRERMGLIAAQVLLVACRRLDAVRAAEIGALHGLAQDPLAEATAWARHVATLDAPVLAAHKASINRTGGDTGADRGSE